MGYIFEPDSVTDMSATTCLAMLNVPVVTVLRHTQTCRIDPRSIAKLSLPTTVQSQQNRNINCFLNSHIHAISPRWVPRARQHAGSLSAVRSRTETTFRESTVVDVHLSVQSTRVGAFQVSANGKKKRCWQMSTVLRPCFNLLVMGTSTLLAAVSHAVLATSAKCSADGS